MKFLLDANIYFAAIHDASFLAHYRDDFLRIGPRTFLSSVVMAELLQGAKGELGVVMAELLQGAKGELGRARINRATQHLERAGRVVPPTHDDWVSAGTVQGRIWDDDASLRTKRLLNDILIACASRRIDAILITENTRDFRLIQRYLPHRALTMAEVAKALPMR
ncbi:MAG: type II toxin-antitoxin system VapC family toxin [Polyangiaceae bacterium]|nr:type II toxin-antitoxin system VapC family toxin [Polyangiaceae bacterium]